MCFMVVDLINKNGLMVRLDVYSSSPAYKMKAYYSNKSTAPMDKMTLLLAAPKTMHLKMSPVSSDSVPPKSDGMVTQSITIDNPSQVQQTSIYQLTKN